MRMRQAQKILRCFALEIPHHPPGHVLDVERALAQVGIVDLAQGLGVMRCHPLENEFDVAQVRLQLAQDFVDQRPVFDHEQVGIENSRVLRSDGLSDLFLHLEDL